MINEDEEAKMEQEKKDREAASVKKREELVTLELTRKLRNLDRERKLYQHQDAMEQFKLMLSDLVKSTSVTWQDMKQVAKEKGRWNFDNVLMQSDMEALFANHWEHIRAKGKERFWSVA